MVNLPLAMIGGIAAIYLTESDTWWRNTFALFGIGARYIPPVISIASMVGFVTLFGIAVRNGILLVNHYVHIVQNEGKSLDQAIVQGSLERLSPILMTALCAALGLFPIAWNAGEPGSELLAPSGHRGSGWTHFVHLSEPVCCSRGICAGVRRTIQLRAHTGLPARRVAQAVRFPQTLPIR